MKKKNPARMQKRIDSWFGAQSFLGAKSERKIGHNTKVAIVGEREDGISIGVIYHSTAIVVYYGDGSIKLHTGGWHTSTTKDRMNKFIPAGYYIYQKKFEWILRTPQGEVEYYDGMIIPQAHQAFAAMQRTPQQLSFSNRPKLRNPMSPRAAMFIKRKIPQLVHEGYGVSRAVASAYSEARRKGFRSVPVKRKKNSYSRKSLRSYRPARGSKSMVKIYDKADNLMASGSVNAGTAGITKGTKFEHPFSTKPSVFGVTRSGNYYLAKGSIVLKPKGATLFKTYGKSEEMSPQAAAEISKVSVRSIPKSKSRRSKYAYSRRSVARQSA